MIKKILSPPLLLILLLIISLSSFLFNINVSAVTSSTINGLEVFTGTSDTNQQNFVNVGGYDVVLVGRILLFYDINGVLAKTYNVTGTLYNDIFIKMIAYNSTHIAIGSINSVYPTNNFITGYMRLLNVNTLSVTTYTFPSDVLVSTYSNNVGVPVGSLALYVADNNIYCIGAGTYAGTYGIGCWVTFPNNGTTKTVAKIENTASTDVIPLGKCWITISSTDSNTFYLIGATAIGSHLFLIDKINYVTGTFELIGTDGLTGGYSGGYIYLLNNVYTIIGTSSYYQVLIYYPDHLANQQLCLNIIRFNNTFVDVHHKITIGGLAGTFQAPYIRLLGYDYAQNGSGLDGLYNLYYVGLDYKFMQLPILLTGTSTYNIVFSLVANIKASYFSQWQTELYNFQTGNLGGFWNKNSGVMIELDYSSTTNSLCCATKFLSTANGGSSGVGSGGGNWYTDINTPTITPIPTSGNSNSGSTIINIITNWQNLAIIVIYAVIVGICTYLFAFTGLIAGLDIATVICFITGLLGGLMYPVLGLVIISNIALIITGSGLLNRRKNGTDA